MSRPDQDRGENISRERRSSKRDREVDDGVEEGEEDEEEEAFAPPVSKQRH